LKNVILLKKEESQRKRLDERYREESKGNRVTDEDIVKDREI
jgi:hypothetical protein